MAVATYGSIAQAARATHVTPSGMSQQLGKLERETGHRLLEPHGRSVRLTGAGRILVEHARQVVARLAVAESDLADLDDEVLGPLRLGAVGSTIRTLLPDVLAALVGEYPRLSLTVRDGETVDLVPGLLDDDLDLLVVESWENSPMPLPEGVTRRLLVEEEAWVALPAHHWLADRACVDLAEVTGLAWVSCPPGTAHHDALVQALRDRGREPDVRFTVADHPTQLALVEAGLAVALTPTMARRSAHAGVRFVPIRPALRRDIRALWRDHAPSPAIRACVAALCRAIDRTGE